MSQKGKRIAGISIVLVFIGLIIFFVYRVFKGPTMSGPKNDPKSEMNQSEPMYNAYTVQEQDPVYLEGMASLNNDHSYFYDSKIGEIELTSVKDGQKVTAGQVLFKYRVEEQKEAMEDAQLAQTRLYNQREELIDQLSKITGRVYNWQGDALEGYWAADGNKYYYVAEAIGKGGQVISSNLVPAEQVEPSQADGQVPGEGGEESIKSQIRQVNQQIEDIEIKIGRLNKKKSEVKAKYGGKVMIDEQGLIDESIPYIRIISDEVSVAGSVDEYQFHLISENQPVELYINAEDRYVGGKVVEFNTLPPAQGPQTSTDSPDNYTDMGLRRSSGVKFNFKVRPDEFIQPGFSVKVQVGLGGLSLPDSVIVEEGDKTYVFVYENGVANKKEITLEKKGSQRVVLRGVDIGQVLIMSPEGLVDGSPVNVFQPGSLDGELMEEGMGDPAEKPIVEIEVGGRGDGGVEF